MEADDEQLEYPVVYAAAKNGWAVNDLTADPELRTNVNDLLDTMISAVPSPDLDPKGDLKMLVTQTASDQFFGKMLIGRIASGSITIGDKISAIDQNGEIDTQAKVMRI